MANDSLVVTLKPSAMSRINEVVREMEQRGFHVQQTMPELGAVFGAGSSSVARAVEGLSEVETVRPEQRFQLPVFDEAVPQ